MRFTSAKSHALIIAIASLLSACVNQSDYLGNRDAITLQSGDAVATNMASQMIDPWPPHAARKDIAFDGARMARAIETYRHGKAQEVPVLLPPPSGK